MLLGSDSDVTKQVLLMHITKKKKGEFILKQLKAHYFVKASITVKACTWFICLSMWLFDPEEERCAIDTR